MKVLANELQPPTPEELTALHLHIEDTLIMMRDGRISEIGPCGSPRNGLVVKEYNGSSSDVIRIGTRWACEMIIKKFIEMRAKQ